MGGRDEAWGGRAFVMYDRLPVSEGEGVGGVGGRRASPGEGGVAPLAAPGRPSALCKLTPQHSLPQTPQLPAASTPAPQNTASCQN